MTVWWKCLGASVPIPVVRSTLPFCSGLFEKCGLIVGHILGTAPLSNSWILSIVLLYIALNMTPNIDCYWVGAVPKPYVPAWNS